MGIIIKLAQFFLCFSILVIIHELGHFMFARLFKVRVEKFYLFFDPWFSLFKFKKGDTEYGMGWVPFGGYVKISGMIDESMDTEQLKQPPKPYEFRSKSAWQRLLIMTGGVLMNVVLAIAIYIGMSYAWGDSYIANEDVTYGYAFNDAGHETGFADGDRIVDIDGKAATGDWVKLWEAIVIGQANYVTVERNGVKTRIDIPTEKVSQILKSPDLMEPRIPFVISKLTEEGAAVSAGLQAGDSLIYFNGQPMGFYNDFHTAFTENKGQTVQLGFVRDSAGISKIMTLPVAVSDEGVIGVYPKDITSFLKMSSHDYTFLQAIPEGIRRAGAMIGSYWNQLKLVFTPKTEAYKQMGSFIAIGSMFSQQWDWASFWRLTAFLSVALAIMNILPIPALDGGHVLFLLYEVITRRKPNEKFMEYAQITGMIIVLGLIILLTFNDIYKLFIK